MKSVAAVMAHPDDAEITLAGTLAMLAERGVSATIATFCTPDSMEPAGARRQAAEEAASLLGSQLVWVQKGNRSRVEDFNDNELVPAVDGLLSRLAPDVVFSHWDRDSHVDHVRIAKAVNAATRRWHGDLYAVPPSEFRTPSLVEFQPNIFVDITDFERLKLAALTKYDIADTWFQPLNLEALQALWRAAGAVAGFTAAESFLLVRQRGLALETIGGPAYPVRPLVKDVPSWARLPTS